MSRIVVGTDGSQNSRSALEWAVREAGLRAVPLTVVTVVQAVCGAWGSPVLYGTDGELVTQARTEAEETTDKVIAETGGPRPAGVNVRALSGMPADVLIAESEAADMVVVGSRGTGGFARLLLGSVGNQVVHHAHCPVVVIPELGRS
jgi:nucleotide-binding universal stress UspA family protein